MEEDLNVFDQNKKFIVIALTVISFLSLFSSLLIIFTYVCFKKIRNYAYKLVVFLSFGNVILNIGNILSIGTIQNEEEDSLCSAQAFLVNYGGLTAIVWTSVIAWSIYSATVLSAKNLREKNWRFFAFGYGVPLALSTIPFMTNQYGRAGFFCWIKNDLSEKDSVMTFVQFYVPLWIALIFNIYAYIKVVRFIKKYISTTLEIRFIQRLKCYPLVLVFCWSFATINRIYNFFGPEVLALTFLHVAFGSLQGFFNALVFASNSQVRQIWKEKFCCCFVGPLSYSKYADTSLKKNEEMQQNQDQEEHHENQEPQEQHEDIQSHHDDANNASLELVQNNSVGNKKKGGLKGTKLQIRV